jgi:hypothetical protein
MFRAMNKPPTISSLINSPDTKLETVFKHSQFPNVLRQETSEIVRFLTCHANMSRLIRYALTTELWEEDPTKRFQMLSVAILSESTSKLKEQLSCNPLLLAQIKAFPDSSYYRHSVVCGNFSRIVLFLARATEGEILGTEFAFLSNYLTQNLGFLSLNKLFHSLIVDFSIPFAVSSEMIQSILKQLSNPPMVFPTLFLFRNILKSQPDFISLIDDDATIRRFISIGVDSYFKAPLVAHEAFSISRSILDKTPTATQSSIFKPFSSQSDINCATAAALLVFPDDVIHFIPRFFAGTFPTILNRAIRQVLTRLPAMALSDLAEQTHICKLAVDAFDSYAAAKTNGDLLEVIRLFSERGIYCCKAHKTEWKAFTRGHLRERYQLVMSNYGGMGQEVSDLQKRLFESMDDLYSILGTDEDD